MVEDEHGRRRPTPQRVCRLCRLAPDRERRLLALGALRPRELVDDAYISFRYTRNLAAGQGLVFNPGERVEGYTNFLWVVLLAVPALLGIDIPTAGQVLGGLCAGLTIFTTAFLLPPASPLTWRRLLAPALLALNATFAMWAVHGLETALFTLLVTLGVRADLYARTRRGWSGGPGVWWALATLTRPEGAALFAASLGYDLVRRRRRWLEERGWVTLLVYGGIVGAHLAWRLGYYGYPLPNTFYAKAGLSWPLIRRGVGYVSAFFFEVHSAAWLLMVPAVLRARRDARLGYLVWMASAYLAAVAVEGGDFFPAYRFVVPIYPLLYTLAQEGTWVVLRWLRPFAPARAARVAVLLLLLLWLPHTFAMRRSADVESAGGEAFTGSLKMAALELKRHFPPATTIAANPVGALAYYSDLHVIDLLGLTDVHIAHSPAPELGTGIAAHEKGDGNYVFARKPDAFLVGNVLINGTPPGIFMTQTWPAWLKSEREFVQRPELKQWYRRQFLRLPDGRYLYFLQRVENGPHSRPYENM